MFWNAYELRLEVPVQDASSTGDSSSGAATVLGSHIGSFGKGRGSHIPSTRGSTKGSHLFSEHRVTMEPAEQQYFS